VITDDTELFVHRRNTAAFIAADHETITLIPRAHQRTSTGGFKWVELAPRPPQELKISERNSTARTDVRVIGGVQHEIEMTLVGLWDAEMAANDIFDHNGARWQIVQVEHFNGYEQRASVIRFGT
jgi:hypothetical protein